MVEVRPLRATEYDAWLALRQRLWPDSARDVLTREQIEIIADSERNGVLVAVSATGTPIGFVELAVRDWAEGCETQPVGYIEGWYVEPEYRRTGVGRRLVEAGEAWARGRGCREMGSDADLSNETSHRAHRALGYREVERIVLFSKRITQG
jgi:aminoglycoside 6'-N-acetyltransferase I